MDWTGAGQAYFIIVGLVLSVVAAASLHEWLDARLGPKTAVSLTAAFAAAPLSLLVGWSMALGD